MSDQDFTHPPPNLKEKPKRGSKTAWVCDACRRKKIRCDRRPNDAKCLNCRDFSSECTYYGVVERRDKEYIRNLEKRVAELERFLKKVRPDLDLGHYSFSDDNVHSPLNGQPAGAPNPLAVLASPSSSRWTAEPGRTSVPSDPSDPDISDSEDEFIQNTLVDQMRGLSVVPAHHRYFGKLSDVSMIRTALQMKKNYTNEGGPPQESSEFNNMVRNPHFWVVYPWESSAFEKPVPDYDFPEEDLLWHLIRLYFDRVNHLAPLLHRPTFEKQIRDGLHLQNERFATVVLLVCAVASRWSPDPRVLSQTTGDARYYSAGWKWFNQVELARKTLCNLPSVFDLQICVLFVHFMAGSSTPHSSWLVVGGGIRMALDIGAHRRKFYGTEKSVEAELYKRAVWILVLHELIFSAGLGRPCTAQVEDMDLDFPLEVDDEYWLHPDPEQAFKQPAGKPSRMSYFNYRLKLAGILSTALNVLYSTAKYKIAHGYVGHEWEVRLLSELDSSLNEWFDGIPDHLRWDPHREDHLFFEQSTSLYGNFHHVQIVVHRAFVSFKKSSQLALSCMAICTNSARSICAIVDAERKRGMAIEDLIIPSFVACVVIIWNVWRNQRTSNSVDLEKRMEDFHKCKAAVEDWSHRLRFAGALSHVLGDLLTGGDPLLTKCGYAPSLKRSRGLDDPSTSPERRATKLATSFTTSDPTSAGSSAGNSHGQLESAGTPSGGTDNVNITSVMSNPGPFIANLSNSAYRPSSFPSSAGITDGYIGSANTNSEAQELLNPNMFSIDQATYQWFLSDISASFGNTPNPSGHAGSTELAMVNGEPQMFGTGLSAPNSDPTNVWFGPTNVWQPYPNGGQPH